MAKKTASKSKSAAVQQSVKFTNGGFYQDLGGDLWFCTNAKQKKVGDGNVVMIQRTEDGQPVGEVTEELVGSFNKQLTAAELKEYRAVCRRESDAEGKGSSETAPASGSTGKTKAKKVTPTTDLPKKMSALDAAAKVLGESADRADGWTRRSASGRIRELILKLAREHSPRDFRTCRRDVSHRSSHATPSG
jgi:hypothetical protein